MLWIRSNVVIPGILHHVRHLSLRDATVGVIDEKMLTVVLVPNRLAPRSHERSVYITGIYHSPCGYAGPTTSSHARCHGWESINRVSLKPGAVQRNPT